MWLCGHVAMWLCGYVAMWLCGYVPMWLFWTLCLSPSRWTPINLPVSSDSLAEMVGFPIASFRCSIWSEFLLVTFCVVISMFGTTHNKKNGKRAWRVNFWVGEIKNPILKSAKAIGNELEEFEGRSENMAIQKMMSMEAGRCLGKLRDLCLHQYRRECYRACQYQNLPKPLQTNQKR